MKSGYTSDSRMPPELKNAWVRALRSGKYKKTKNALEKRVFRGKYIGNCCLGVLCRVYGVPGEPTQYGGVKFKGSCSILNVALKKCFGLGHADTSELVTMNDGYYNQRSKPFAAIATFIEKNIGVGKRKWKKK